MLLTQTDGSLAREHVRDQYYGKDWDAFNHSVEQRRPTGGEGVPNEAAFWWLLPDIIVCATLTNPANSLTI